MIYVRELLRFVECIYWRLICLIVVISDVNGRFFAYSAHISGQILTDILAFLCVLQLTVKSMNKRHVVIGVVSLIHWSLSRPPTDHRTLLKIAKLGIIIHLNCHGLGACFCSRRHIQRLRHRALRVVVWLAHPNIITFLIQTAILQCRVDALSVTVIVIGTPGAIFRHHGIHRPRFIFKHSSARLWSAIIERNNDKTTTLFGSDRHHPCSASFYR